jgi:hypothetical protein
VLGLDLVKDVAQLYNLRLIKINGHRPVVGVHKKYRLGCHHAQNKIYGSKPCPVFRTASHGSALRYYVATRRQTETGIMRFASAAFQSHDENDIPRSTCYCAQSFS